MKTYHIVYRNWLLQELEGTQKAFCEEVAILVFCTTHGVYNIISCEEV